MGSIWIKEKRTRGRIDLWFPNERPEMSISYRTQKKLLKMPKINLPPLWLLLVRNYYQRSPYTQPVIFWKPASQVYLFPHSNEAWAANQQDRRQVAVVRAQLLTVLLTSPFKRTALFTLFSNEPFANCFQVKGSWLIYDFGWVSKAIQ